MGGQGSQSGTSQKLGVAILGGGMAGGLLARQLARTRPDLSIGIFEKSEQSAYKVGESTVELSSNYFLRKLGLSSYLYDRHYPKNGLRFLFDSAAADTALEDMSELGSQSLPFHPSFQIDRARMDDDLLAMAAEAGTLVRRGVRVRNLRLGERGEPHRFEVHELGAPQAARPQHIEARWVVDASGRARMIAKQNDLHVPERQLQNAAVWGRFEGVTDIDALGSDAYRSRVRYSPRRLSTIHFVRAGYWIWFIPLRDGITSIGLVCDKGVYEPELRSEEGFFEFLRRHKAAASLVENAKPVDLACYRHLAYQTRQFFSADRWGLTGEAAAFTDPFYSPGADFIAIENDILCDLIGRDADGQSFEKVGARAELYDEFMRFRQEATMMLYRDQYHLFGSWDACKLKWDFDVASYYNLWVDSYMRDLHLDEDWLRSQLAQKPFILRTLGHFGDLFRRVESHLRARGSYYQHNAGEHNDGRDLLDFQSAEMGRERDQARVLECNARIFNEVRSRALDLLEDAPRPVERKPLPLQAFMGRRPIS